jgi:hypothetical protein
VLLLASTTDKLQVVTGQAAQVDVRADWADYTAPSTVTPGRTNTASIATATTTDVVASPASSVIRNVKACSIRNRHATTACDVTVKHTDGTNALEIIKATLAAGEALIYQEGAGWLMYDNAGNLKQTQLQGVYLQPTTAEQSTSQRVLQSELPHVAPGTFVLISGTQYFVYVGRIVRDTTIKFVEFHVTTVGAGAQTAEVGLFSSTQAPNKGNQSMTKLVATGTVGSLTATGMVRNTAAFNQVVPANTHLWAAIRTAMATTQPTLVGLSSDFLQGQILTLAAGGVLTGAGPFAATVPAIATTTIAPALRVTLD